MWLSLELSAAAVLRWVLVCCFTKTIVFFKVHETFPLMSFIALFVHVGQKISYL